MDRMRTELTSRKGPVSRLSRAGDSMARRGAVDTTRCKRQPAHGPGYVETASGVSFSSANSAAAPGTGHIYQPVSQRRVPDTDTS